jgi:hypothetical protein
MTVKSTDAKKVITVRTAAFQAAGGRQCRSKTVAAAADPVQVELRRKNLPSRIVRN